MPKPRSISPLKTPMENPIIWRLTLWARRAHPRLRDVQHAYCGEADLAHAQDRRLYAHSFHPKLDPSVICWARAADRLAPNTIAGICLHEFGHLIAGNMKDEAEAERKADVAIAKLLAPLGIELRYRGSNLLQWVNCAELLRRLDEGSR